MKKILEIGLCLVLGSSLLLMNSCEKLVDNATETTDSPESMASDMVALTSLSDALQDIVSTDPNLQMKTGTSIIPREFYRFVNDDSVFTDGDGVKIKFEFEDVNNPDYPYLSIYDNPAPGTGSKGGDGTTRWGSGTININLPFNDPACKVELELDRYIVLKEGTYYQIDDGNAKFGSKYECLLTRTGSETLDFAYNFSFRSRKGSENPSEKSWNAGLFQMTTIDGGSEGILDDEITITGSADECKNTRGKSYSVTINETLKRIVDSSCSNTFVSGELEIKNSGSKVSIKANFGDGTCDNLVEVTLPGGVKKTITVN